jgi:hypothetical protein
MDATIGFVSGVFGVPLAAAAVRRGPAWWAAFGLAALVSLAALAGHAMNVWRVPGLAGDAAASLLASAFLHAPWLGAWAFWGWRRARRATRSSEAGDGSPAR